MFTDDIRSETDLREALDGALAEFEGVKSVRSFEEKGVLTRDEGLVIKMANGAEFYVTIQQTREPDGSEDAEDDEDADEEVEG